MEYYLDVAATTRPKREVIDVMIPYLTEKWHNPSSLYGGGVDVRKDINVARKTIADFINAEEDEIYFTSGASESNNWALQGFVREANKKDKKAAIITSTIEHKSIELCIEGIRTQDLKIAYVEVDKYGFVKTDAIQELMQESFPYSNFVDVLVTIQFGNNEIGVTQNVKEIGSLVHKYCGVFHTDATQMFGKIPIDVKELGIDMMSISGHKIGCPKGIGVLYIKNGINIQPLIYGAQERNYRGGTENVAGIIGLAKAVELCDVSDRKIKELCDKRDYFLSLLKDNFACKLNGSLQSRLSNNINVTFSQNITGESLLYTLDLSGIEIGVGSACNSTSMKPSHVLKAIGLTDEEAMRTVRFTISDDITYKDIDFIIDEIDKAIKIIET